MILKTQFNYREYGFSTENLPYYFKKVSISHQQGFPQDMFFLFISYFEFKLLITTTVIKFKGQDKFRTLEKNSKELSSQVPFTQININLQYM